MNLMDKALQAHTPVIAVPRFEELEPLDKVGHRFLVASDGLWVEVRRTWCHLVVPVAKQEGVAIPYGKVERRVWLAFGKFPVWVLERFQRQALEAFPVETAAVVIWDEETSELEYRECPPVSAGVGFLKAKWPELSATQSIAIDLHSHGPIGAYFSAEDRRDMGSEVVVACVVGRLHEEPEVAISLFACGKELRVKMPGSLAGSGEAQGGQDACDEVDKAHA